MKIKFLGATETVTGSKHLLITDGGKQILMDCGLYQGMGKETDELNRHLGVNPSSIDAIILSHAHIDHSGNLPLIVKQGFTGKIYCSKATRDVCKILLIDSAHIHETEIAYVNKRRKKEGKELLKPLYTVKDAEKALQYFRPIPMNTDFTLNNEVVVHFTDAGHILGSAVVNLTLKGKDKVTRFTYTGDVGRYGDLLMKDPAPFPQADYIICESTYGNKLHEKSVRVEDRLFEILTETCVKNKGRLIIPAFSLGRTQEIVYLLNKLFNKGLLPKIKIFVDSPLSSSATEIMREYSGYLNQDVRDTLIKDEDPFGFDGLEYITEQEDSKKINFSKEPCVIISASGMMDAGRIKHHLMHGLPEHNNTLLVVGYCSPQSLGGKILRGDKEVKIFGELIKVNCKVEVVSSLSAHADYEEMLRFLSCQAKEQIKKVFLVHGEDEAKETFSKTLINVGYNAYIPKKGEEINLVM